MADERKDVHEKDSSDENPDFYVRTLAATWGHLDLIRDWVRLHEDEPEKVTENVLFPAAMYGQLEVLNFAIPFGDLHRIDNSSTYPGWTLMHFAVEGAQRNVIISDPVQTTVIPKFVDYSSIVSGVPETQPRTPEEVLWKQLDIIVMLAERGVPLDHADNAGHSASFRACHELEVSFLEGAILLDILAILKAEKESVERESDERSPKSKVDTPGLQVGKLPGSRGWTKAVQQVVEWAYSRKHYMILRFFHQHRIIDLTSPKLTLTSPQLVLRNYHHPLLMDAVRKGDYKLLRLVLEPMPSGSFCSPQDILTRVYEYEFGNTGKRKESILSYACSKYFEENGNDSTLGSLLSPEVLGSHITNVTLVGVGLRRLPIVLFHKTLKSLDVRENNIDFLPSGTADQSRLNWNCPVLHVLNISHNLFTTLHPDLFRLPCLSKLIAAGNKIQDVPRDIWTAPALQHIDLDDNLISALPCPANIPRQGSLIFSPFFSPPTSPTLVANQEGVSLSSMRQAFVNYEAHSSEELHKSQSGFCLMTIYLSGNQLTEIPKGLPCLAPFLHTLKVARNKITDLGYTSDYPAFLQTLDASNNSISSGIKPTLQPLQFPCLQSSLLVNTPSLCSHFNNYKMRNLKFLYLSGNRLKYLQMEIMKSDLEISNQSVCIDDTSFQSEMLFPRLQGLRLSNNCLTRFPENIHKLERLCELAIDENPNIQRLPLNLYHLSGLFTFKFHGIGDPIIHELKMFKSSTADLLYYLRALETEARQNTSMRLFIIGHFHKGKTTLLTLLRGRRTDSTFDQRVKRIQNGNSSLNLTQEDKASTVGIECGKWVCSKKHGAPKNAPKITFYTWDFAGQEEYYLTHQCFLTNRALFVLVWNVLDGDEGIESISIWLQNLQAKAPRSTVVVVGTHLDVIPRAERDRRCRIWRDKLEKYSFSRQHSKAFPRIVGLHFTGCPQKGRPIEMETLNDLLYDVAMDMDAPRDFSSKIPASLKIKILQEKIPKSYDNLRRRIEVLAEEARLKKKSPVMHKQEFCNKVNDIINGVEETEIAVDFLHTTTGMVLHFKIPALTDYYIIDPQQWFDLCALVISPENVSKLVKRNIGRDPNCGLLNCERMDHEFENRGYDKKIGKLIRTFLHEYNVIHQINNQSFLVPSAISADPLPLEQEQGVFPFSHPPPTCMDDLTSFPSIGPSVLNQTASTNGAMVKVTGLLYRRLLLLPPIASGFWSKLISLFIQKHDFQQIVHGSAPANFSLQRGSAHHLLCMVGNLTLEWQYWKTGIMLFLDNQLLLRVNSLRSHEFEDPQERVVLSNTHNKVKYFHFKGNTGWQFVPRHYTEVIEVVVPEVCIIQKEMDPRPQVSNPMNAKILTKALEIIDEVMKNHCEHLATSGIYAVNDLLHVVPCPLCFGDTDNRPTELSLTDSLDRTLDLPLMSINPTRIALQGDETPLAMEDSVEVEQRPQQNGSIPSPLDGQNSIYVFTVDDCIKQTFVSDHIECPIHGQLEAQYLVPDLVFADLADVRLEKGNLSAPLDRSEEPDAMGSFGVVVKRVLFEADKGETEVAVKIFSRYDDTSCDSSTELIKNYSDMRYELNKLSSLEHPHIVRFIGVFTNPHCFVLEWAPEKTLQHIHQKHAENSVNFCTTSLFLVLLQITNALIYLHEEVGIVHRDLKLSNILVFHFPKLDHICYNGRKDVAQACTSCFPSEQASSGVLLKLTDMGICVNPAAHRAKDNTGIRQFVPECLTSDTLANLTEKVDIFTLGSCLYEFMTLRCLPPDDISEIEYKHMLQSGKKPQFYRRDASYPLLLFQFLEECWQHKHFKRPSAEGLKRALQTLTGFSVQDDSETVRYSPQRLLMDTFVLHQTHRVSASHAIAAQDSFSVCAALSSPDESTTTVAVVNYQHTNLKTKLQMKTLGELKNQHVSALHMTPDNDILVGCGDGKVILFDSLGTKMISDPASVCYPDYHHGEIIGLYHDVEGKLLIIGFSSGNVHIKKCTEGIRNCLVNQREDFCSSISNRLQLHALECVSSQSTSALEIWCGSEESKIEVWSLPEREHLMPTLDTVSQQRQITTVQAGHTTMGEGGMVVKQMTPGTGLCEAKMVALLHKQNTTVIAFVDMTSKIIEKTIQCNLSIASFTLSPTKLLIGTYDGEILLCDTEKLLNNESTVQTFSSQPVEELQGHCYTVYSLLCVNGHINTDGTTSFFPTFIGKVNEPIQQEFLVSIGFGKGHKELTNIFKGSVVKEGTYINAWLL